MGDAKAQIMAAAWAAASALGVAKAIELLEAAISELRSHQWGGR